jgi:hypothetical protein
LLSGFRFDISNNHRRTGLRQPLSNPRAKCAAPAGDYSNFVGKKW